MKMFIVGQIAGVIGPVIFIAGQIAGVIAGAIFIAGHIAPEITAKASRPDTGCIAQF